MKTDSKNEKKSSMLKRSIGARIMLIVFLILAGIMALLLIFTESLISRYIKNYYENTGELLATLAAEDLDYYLTELEEGEDCQAEFENSQEAEDLRQLSSQYNIYSLWVETSKPPYEKAENQIYLPISDEVKDELPEPHQVYETGQSEKNIFLENTDHGIVRYKSAHGVNLVCYLHGVYDDDKNCIAVIGLNFNEDENQKDIKTSVTRMGWIIAAAFVGLMLVLGLLLHFSIFNPLRKISSKMRGYVSGDKLNDDKLEVKGQDELSYVASSYNQMTDEIRDYVAQVGTLEKERLTREAEMNVATQIQAGMLPPGKNNFGQIQIEAVMNPAREVGGDFYDYLTLPDGRVFFSIGDVSGKGMTAALFMAAAENTIRYNAALYGSPAKAMYAANNDLCDRNPEQLFVTAFAALYDPASGKLTYCSAGHDPAYLTGVGSVEALKGEGNLLLGVFPDEEYSDITIDIAPGDTLFLYTDGLTEAMDPDEAMFGRDRVEEELKRCAVEEAESSLIGRMTGAVKNFVRGAEASDDLTMMTIQFGKTKVLTARTDENMTLRRFLLEEEGLTESEKKKICLAAEEIFVNICRHAYNNSEAGTIWVQTLITGSEFLLTFVDTGIAYNPLTVVQDPKEYDPDEQMGGLGKLMAFTIMDRQHYEYREGFNVLTLIKSLERERRESL